MWADILLVLRWWGTLFLVGAAAFPLAKRLFRAWHDQGYVFAKAIGMATVAWMLYAGGTVHLLPFTQASIYMALGIVFVVGLLVSRDKTRNTGENRKTIRRIIFFEELFFFVALLFWSWIKAHEPSIHGLEKFMDYGFTQSILNARFFPAPDMWFAGSNINYYYFGHIVMASLTKLSGMDLAITFNLMLATLFALTLTMSFSIGMQLIGRIGGLLAAFLVTLAGNMQTLYAFTRGYTGDDVKPFWELAWSFGEGLQRYWYANATRFIPFTIHEFPSYSFVVSDVHGHVLSLPFVLLAITLLVQMNFSLFHLIFYGFVSGILLMTNALDGPIYLGLLCVILLVLGKDIRRLGIAVLVAVITSLPFLVHFKSFVSGVAVNCPPAFLANTKIGPVLFEEIEKCQHSPLWMLWVLWGFFMFCGLWLVGKNIWDKKITQKEKLLLVFFVFSIALIIFPELFYFKDIYPQHFRSNTMFKLGYQAFILLSIVSSYAIVSLKRNILFLVLLAPQLFLVSIYPLFSVRSYFNQLKTHVGINGTSWIAQQYPDDWAAIEWLNSYATRDMRYVIAEADGDSYTDYARFSAFTGLPTIIGWPVHEWLWRGSYDVVAPRREEVRVIYESDDMDKTQEILRKYNVGYIIVGTLEREKFTLLAEEKFFSLGEVVFERGATRIYKTRY